MALKDDIKRIRTDNGYTQSEMADMLNVSRSTLSKWETGNAVPSANDLQNIKSKFQVSLVRIVGEGRYSINNAMIGIDLLSVFINGWDIAGAVVLISSHHTGFEFIF